MTSEPAQQLVTYLTIATIRGIVIVNCITGSFQRRDDVPSIVKRFLTIENPSGDFGFALIIAQRWLDPRRAREGASHTLRLSNSLP